ncbi:TGF-beta receptor type-2-like isoform X2 [Phyllopteryx taeniolatus]|uniref:TGF-beta receptor type-2-like isoform X2 n=1 Tax=Phyllopteryx taeniolatus TaxID=161469 RepID=UPI002AD289FB|nr:TGF-beta receptor type-2-like isoform X2 [Phyllopteryx taeniolatus]
MMSQEGGPEWLVGGACSHLDGKHLDARERAHSSVKCTSISMLSSFSMWSDKLIIAIVITITTSSAVSFSGHLNFNVCMWCEASRPICRDRVCSSNCSLSSFCSSLHEICVAVWCHNPALPLDGVEETKLLLNSTSHECHMTRAAQTSQTAQLGVILHVCGCSGEHECNDKLIFRRAANGLPSAWDKEVIPAVLVSLVLPVLAVAIVATLYWASKRRSHKSARLRPLCPPSPPAHPDGTGKNTPELFRAAAPSGTPGPGQADQLPAVHLEAAVGGGRFAQVWRARLLGESPHQAGGGSVVAVKVFLRAEVASWRHEGAILGDAGMRHRNIVPFLGAQVRGGAYWLLLAYHRLGNLQDFLTANVLSWKRLVTMATGLARGLAHLHSDTLWPSGSPKVSVAHRDVKSGNVLVKEDGDVALCDFGLAVQLHAELTVDDFANSGQVGTARYMSPEALESRVNLEDGGESFKQMDVYSMALVLWEMASRCHVGREVPGYTPAFTGLVGERPCVDVMRDVVIRARQRPDMPTTWTRHRGMSVYCATVTECWDHDPEARLTAHCVLERLHGLIRREEGQEVRPC